MANLYETITELCKSKNITGYRLCKDIGVTPSVLTDLKMGRKVGLSAKNANKIATYFGVSVAYLLGEEKVSTSAAGEEHKPENVNIIKIAGRDGSFQERQLTDDQLAAIKAIIAQMPDASDDL